MHRVEEKNEKSPVRSARLPRGPPCLVVLSTGLGTTSQGALPGGPCGERPPPAGGLCLPALFDSLFFSLLPLPSSSSLFFFFSLFFATEERRPAAAVRHHPSGGSRQIPDPFWDEIQPTSRGPTPRDVQKSTRNRTENVQKSYRRYRTKY